MKKYVLVLSFFISTLAIAQPPVDKPADKPEETKEKKDDKPKEKKDKKPRTFRLIGVEAAKGTQYYKTPGNYNNPFTESGIFRKLISDDSPFFTYFGNNTTSNYGGSSLADYTYDTKTWFNYSDQTNVTTTWGFGKRGDVNQKHVIKIGAGYSNRSYNSVSYSLTEYQDTDTTGYTYIGSDTVVHIKDTTVSINCSLSNYVKMGQVSLAYNYRIHPEEKLSLSFGGGIDVALGTATILGTIRRTNRSQSYGQSTSINGQNNVWYYYDNQNSISKGTKLGEVEEKRFKAATFRAYVDFRVDYRLSKKFPVLKNINVFVLGRLGKEFSNIGKRYHDSAPTYLGFNLGLTFNFFKGL